jgi:endonuclease I
MKLKLLLLLLSYTCYAQIPNYYNTIDFTQSGISIKNQLSSLITNTHTTELVYTSGSSGLLDTWTVLKQSDLYTQNITNVILMYGWDDTSSNVTEHYTRDKNLSCHTSSCNGFWVREHVFPRSLGTPNLGSEFAGADAHNLRAIDSQRNNSRSNKIFGSANSSVSSYSINSNSWYPGDEWRGDVARIIMYMYLRYPTQCNPLMVSTSNSTIAPLADMPDLFLEWNRLDPPSQFEINRNNVIALNQGNRNPFIDNPYLATIIWSGQSAIDTWGVLSTKNNSLESISFYPTITTDVVYFKNDDDNNSKIFVYNMLGQNITINKNNNHLDFSNQNNGVYIIKYVVENQSKVFKIVKR